MFRSYCTIIKTIYNVPNLFRIAFYKRSKFFIKRYKKKFIKRLQYIHVSNLVIIFAINWKINQFKFETEKNLTVATLHEKTISNLSTNLISRSFSIIPKDLFLLYNKWRIEAIFKNPTTRVPLSAFPLSFDVRHRDSLLSRL